MATLCTLGLMSKNKYIVIGLDGVLVDTNNILLNSFNEYAKNKFPNFKINLNNSENDNILQLIERADVFKAKSIEKSAYKQMEIESSRLRKHIKAINKILIQKLSEEFEMVSAQSLLNIDNLFKIAITSNLDAEPTFEIIKRLGISDRVSIIFSRNDIDNLPPATEMYENIFNFFECDANEVMIFERNANFIKAAKKTESNIILIKNTNDFENKIKTMFQNQV